jgi:hypothetical protein
MAEANPITAITTLARTRTIASMLACTTLVCAHYDAAVEPQRRTAFPNGIIVRCAHGDELTTVNSAVSGCADVGRGKY